MLLVLLHVLPPVDVVLVIVELGVGALDREVASCFWHVSYKYQII